MLREQSSAGQNETLKQLRDEYEFCPTSAQINSSFHAVHFCLCCCRLLYENRKHHTISLWILDSSHKDHHLSSFRINALLHNLTADRRFNCISRLSSESQTATPTAHTGICDAAKRLMFRVALHRFDWIFLLTMLPGNSAFCWCFCAWISLRATFLKLLRSCETDKTCSRSERHATQRGAVWPGQRPLKKVYGAFCCF